MSAANTPPDSLKTLEASLKNLSHNTQALEIIQSFVQSVGKTKARQQLFNANGALVRSHIDYQAEYGVSCDTLYRSLRQGSRPKALNLADSGIPRKVSRQEMELYCEVIAAFKIRTCNKKGRHISTIRAIELLEEYEMDTPKGFIKPPRSLLTRSTVNYYLKALLLNN